MSAVTKLNHINSQLTLLENNENTSPVFHIKRDLELYIELLFVLYGIAVFFPWHMILNSSEYIVSDIFPKTGWSFQWLKASNAGALSGFLAMALMSNSVSLLTRFLVSWSTIIVAIILMTIILLAMPQTRHGFVLSLLIVFVMDFTVAIASTTFLGFSFMLTKECSERYFLGYALSGLLSFGMTLIFAQTLLRLDNGIKLSIGVSYPLATCLVIVCLVLIPWILSRSSVKQLMEDKDVSSNGDDTANTIVQWNKQRLVDLGRTVKIAWSPLLANIFIGGLTYFIYPGVILQYVAIEDFPHLLTWLIGMYQVGDVLGRILASYTKVQMTAVWIVIALRFIFVPLAILSQRVENNFIQSSAFRLILVFTLGLTNGLLFTLSCLRVPDKAVGSKQIEDCGFCTSLSTVIGFFIGGYSAPLSQIGIMEPLN